MYMCDIYIYIVYKQYFKINTFNFHNYYLCLILILFLFIIGVFGFFDPASIILKGVEFG